MPTPTRVSSPPTPCSSRSIGQRAPLVFPKRCGPRSRGRAVFRPERPMLTSRVLGAAVSLLAVSLLAAACAPPPLEAPDVAPLFEDDIALRARLLAMTDARRPDSMLIESALDRARPSVLRAAAALAAGQVGASGFVPRLRVLLA